MTTHNAPPWAPLSAEETLVELEKDFSQFVDADLQRQLNATYDKSLRERLRLCLVGAAKGMAALADKDTELAEEFENLEVEYGRLEDKVEKLEAENERLERELDALKNQKAV